MHLIATHAGTTLAVTPDDADIDHAAVAAMVDLGLTGAYTVTRAERAGDGWRSAGETGVVRWFDGSQTEPSLKIRAHVAPSAPASGSGQ